MVDHIVQAVYLPLLRMDTVQEGAPVLLKEPEDPKLSRFAPFTADLARKENKPTYYPCETGACSLPFTED